MILLLLACVEPAVPEGPWYDVSAEKGVCGINRDHRIYCWGNEVYGFMQRIPTGRFERVSLSSTGGCALDAEGEAECWGSVRGTAHLGLERPPAGPWRDLSVGVNAQCFIDSAGEIACQGDDYLGDYPQGTYATVSVGDHLACVLDLTGEIDCWGSAEHRMTVPPPPGPWSEISVGAGAACVSNDAGGAACFGEILTTDFLPAAEELFGAEGVLKVELLRVACAIRSNGHLLCARHDLEDYGAGFTDFDIGDNFACTLRDGEIECFGEVTHGAPVGTVREDDTGAG